jgi:PAS domain S-box-containing protein
VDNATVVARMDALGQHDVLEREVADLREQLAHARRRLQEAEALARIGSWEWDIPTNTVTWSDELYRIYGLEPQAFVPTYEHFLGRVHPDDRDSVDERNRKAFADHEPFEDVKRIIRPDGSEFLMRTQGEVICDDDGAPIRMLGVCEDVTAEVRAREARELLASVVHSSTDAIFTVGTDGRIITWNPGAQRLFGYAEAEAIGQSASILVPAQEAQDERRLMEAALAAETVDPLETIRRRRDGGTVDVSLAMSPISAADGKVTGVSVIARDITERRRRGRRSR